jgi:hypothetical protein
LAPCRPRGEGQTGVARPAFAGQLLMSGALISLQKKYTKAWDIRCPYFALLISKFYVQFRPRDHKCPS